MDDVIKHGRSFIWDLEIDSYKDVYLEDFYQDTIIDFEYLHCEEMYRDAHGLQRHGDSSWIIHVPFRSDISKELLEKACKELSAHTDFIKSYFVSDDEYTNSEIVVLIYENMSIFDAFNYAYKKRDIVINYAFSLEHKKLSTIMNISVEKKRPIYSRAMKKVELELSNFKTDTISNDKKIIEISSRVKTTSSIEEKVYRKNICQFDLFEKFDDIAGVRCTCEFLSDVYDVLEYIKQNPLIKVLSIEDKITTPSKLGYRGIHIIVTTDVYFQGSVYENIKVEIQLRTAFQNAWSMKTHQLTYKRESDVSDEISETMRMMSDALKEADEVAQRIKETLRNN